MEISVTKKWYNKVWLDLLLYILIVPVGLYGIWKSQKIKKVWKILFSLASPGFLFLNVIFVAFIFSFFKSSPAEPYYKEGQALQEAKEYSAAASAYAKAIKTDPKYFKSLLPFAQCLEQLKDYENAIKYYSLALEVDSLNTAAYQSRGLLFMKFGRANKSNEMYKLASKDFSEVLKLDSSNAKIYLERARIGGILEDYSNALNDYNKALLHDKSLNINKEMSMIYLVRGMNSVTDNKNSAIKDFDKVIKLDPNNANAYYFRGMLTIPFADTPNLCGCADIQKAKKLGYKDVDLLIELKCERYPSPSTCPQ